MAAPNLFDLALNIKTQGADDAKKALSQIDSAGKEAATSLKVTADQAREAWAKAGGDMTRFAQELAKLAGASAPVVAAQDRITDSTRKMTLSQLAAIDADRRRTASFMESQRRMALLQIEAIQMDEARTRSMGLMEAEAYRMNKAFDENAKASKGAHGGLGRLSQELVTVTRNALGLNPVVAQTSNLLGTMALGSATMVGILGGIAAVAFAFDKLSASARATKKASDDAIASVRQMLTNSALGPNADLIQQIGKINDEINRQLRIKQNATDRLSTGGSGMAQVKAEAEAEIARLRRIRDAAAGELQLREATARADEAMAAFTTTTERNTRAIKDRTKAIEDMTTPNRGPHIDAQALPPIQDIFQTGPMANIGKGQISDLSRGPAGEHGVFDEAVARTVEEADKAAQRMSEQLASIFGNALVNGILQGIKEGGIFGAFKSLTANILEGFGEMCIQIGIKAIAAAKLISTITSFLVAHPLLALAAGVALVALGSSIGGRNGGGRAEYSVGAGSIGRGSEEITRYKFINRDGSGVGDLMARPNQTFVFYGANDPTAQRWLLDTLDKANRRVG